MNKNDEVIVVSAIHMYYAKIVEVGNIHTIVLSHDGNERNPLTTQIFYTLDEAQEQQRLNMSSIKQSYNHY